MESEPKLTEEPISWAVGTAQLNKVCSFCLLKPKTVLQRCCRCQKNHYCSAECQKEDWTAHKPECRRYEALREATIPEWVPIRSPDFPDDGLRLVCRLMDKLRKTSASELQSDGRSLEDLMSHADEIKELYGSRVEFGVFCDLFRLFIGAKHTDFHKLLQVYGKVKVNSFGIKNEELQSVGSGLYLSLCRLDHSCDPNARIVFRGRLAVLHSLDPVGFPSPLDLSRIRHSYIDNLLPVEDRRHRLESEYFFRCECRGCLNEKRNRLMESYACDDHECGGGVIWTEDDELVCSRCGQSVKDTDTAKLAGSMGSEVLERLQSVRSVDRDRRLEIAAKTATVQENVLSRWNINRMRILRICFETCVLGSRWESAVVYGEKVLETIELYLSEKDPWRFVFAKNLAVTILNADPKSTKSKEKAKRLLEGARPNLEAVFGVDSDAAENLRVLLQRCQ